MKNAWQRMVSFVSGRPRSATIAAVTAGVVFVTGGVALATRQASDQFANAAFSKLGGGDPNAVLDKLADRVVKKLSANNGPLGAARQEIVAKVSKAAAAKISNVDPKALINNASGKVVAAGLDKIDSLDVNKIVDQVTQALIEQAQEEISKLDLNALAKSALDGVIKKVDIEKLIKEKIDSIDVNKLVEDAIAKQIGGSSGGLLGMLFQK